MPNYKCHSKVLRISLSARAKMQPPQRTKVCGSINMRHTQVLRCIALCLPRTNLLSVSIYVRINKFYENFNYLSNIFGIFTFFEFGFAKRRILNSCIPFVPLRHHRETWHSSPLVTLLLPHTNQTYLEVSSKINHLTYSTDSLTNQ